MATTKMKSFLKIVTTDVELTRWENDVCRHALDRYFGKLELIRLTEGNGCVDEEEFFAAGVMKMAFSDKNPKAFDKTWELGAKFSDEKVMYNYVNGSYVDVLHRAVGEAVEEMTKRSPHAGLEALADKLTELRVDVFARAMKLKEKEVC